MAGRCSIPLAGTPRRLSRSSPKTGALQSRTYEGDYPLWPARRLLAEHALSYLRSSRQSAWSCSGLQNLHSSKTQAATGEAEVETVATLSRNSEGATSCAPGPMGVLMCG